MSVAEIYSAGVLYGSVAQASIVETSIARANEVQCEQIGISPGSLQTAVEFNDPVQCSLSRSGIATITATNDNVLVAAAGVSNSSVILATLHVDSGGSIDGTATAVSAVVTGTNQFRIYTNAAATGTVEVSWLIAKL
jgi:hypothetical protein